MADLSLPVAFLAGIISFFAPCVLPLLPAYIGYITGVSLEDLKSSGYKPYLKKILVSNLFFVLGFSIVFVALGIAASGLGALLRKYADIVQRLGGLIILVFGLEFAGIINLAFLAKEKRATLPAWAKGLGYIRAFLLGFIFAAAWTPCIGLVLGSILALAAVSGTVSQGAALLLAYSLGISTAFMLVSLTLTSATKYLRLFRNHPGLLAKLSGMLLIILGALLLTDTYKYLNTWLFDIAFRLGYQIR
jgi:cytochrome c-type biogenesis protein